MPEFLSQGTVTYEQYLQNLQDLADEYRAAGGDGIEKAAELEKDIQKTKFDYIKRLYMESFQIQQELLTTDEKIISAEKQMSDIAVRISELNKLIVDAATDDENIERYKAELALLEQLMKKIGMQLEDLRSESFRVGEMYKMIYGDIEQYGRDVYESMLRQMKNILEESKKAGKKTIDGKDCYEVTYNYKDKSGEIIKKTEILTAKELGDAITSIDKMKTRWKRIILYYGSDNPGITNAKHFSELYGLEYMYNPTIDEKDPFDYSCKYGIRQFYEQLTEQVDDTRTV